MAEELNVYNSAYTGPQIDEAVGKMQNGPFLPLAGGTVTGPLVLSGTPVEENQAANKGYVDAQKPKSVPVTLTAAGWDSSTKQQSVAVAGVLADETKQLIQPVPASASQAAYIEAGILCTGQAANSLTFTAETVPTANLTVYVVITEVQS